MDNNTIEQLSTKIPGNIRRKYYSQFLRDHFFGPGFSDRLFPNNREQIKSSIASAVTSSTLGQGVAVAEETDITPEEFYHKYYYPGRPVVLRGKGAQWKACQQWNFEYFKQRYGDDPVLFVNHEAYGEEEAEEGFEVSTLANYIDTLEEGGKYARFHPLLDRHPELLEDLDRKWINDRMLQKTFGGTIFHILFMGAQGSKTPVHNAGSDNFFLQIEGQKKWTLWPTDYTLMFQPEANRGPAKSCDIDPSNPDLSKYQGYQYLDYYETTINPGDILYIPAYLWHHVENVTRSIGIGARWTAMKNTVRRSPVLACLEAVNTNPSILQNIFRYSGISKREMDFNRILIRSMGYTEADIEEKIQALKARG